MNITVQLAKIINAAQAQPGHVDYRTKKEMGEIAERILVDIEQEMTISVQISNEDRNLICNLARSIILAKDAGYPYFTLTVDGIRANAIIELAEKIVG